MYAHTTQLRQEGGGYMYAHTTQLRQEGGGYTHTTQLRQEDICACMKTHVQHSS